MLVPLIAASMLAAPISGAAVDGLRATRPVLSPSPSQGTGATIYKAGSGVKHPTLVRNVQPKYPRKAMARKIQGVVLLSAVVLENGKVGRVTVTRSLDNEFGLDNEAVKTVKKWRFTPGTKDGKPVAVEIDIEMSFALAK